MEDRGRGYGEWEDGLWRMGEGVWRMSGWGQR